MTDTYYYPITGRKNTGGVFDRISIEEMQASQPYQFTLFVLGYAAVQGVGTTISQSSVLFPGVQLPATSYMEMAGIHGKPYEEYAGDRKTVSDRASDFNANDKKDTLPVPSRFGGYCNHGSVSFTTWHRPYVMLVEQAVGDFAVEFAKQIEQVNPGEKGLWIPAANQLRFPYVVAFGGDIIWRQTGSSDRYWDWADPKVANDGLPPVLYEDTLDIRVAGGKTATVANPFSFYTYQGGVPSDFTDETDSQTGQTAYFAEWTRTYRHPASSPTPPGSDITALQTALKAQADDIRTKIGLLFTFPDGEDPSIMQGTSLDIINESRRQMDYSNRGSLEAVHGVIHGVIGGNGHMSNPDYAAFDPIFFFHHSNVDRLLALWEWCYKDYWMGDGYVHNGASYPWTQQRGTYAQVYNEQILPTGARGALYPFRNEDGTYWTSEQTRFLDSTAYPKYYSYKEFLGIKVDQPATDAERVAARARIAKYYSFDPQGAVQTIDLPSWGHIPVPSSGEYGLPANFQSIPNFRVFIVLARLPEHAFNRSYSLQLFYNGTGHESSVIGSVTVFARADHSPCKACAIRRDAGTVVRGVIPLPPALVNEIIVNSGIDRTTATLETTSADVTRSLSGKLFDTSGKLLASANGGDDAPNVPDTHVADPRVTPVEVVLLSSAVAEHVDDQNQPVYLFDWKPHNDLFPSGWKAEAAEATST
ncbi:common central domain of tyrosinase-domain-containing protein [Phlebopus sp. FC_14]|nr:common central domain of tyrosinase-domain-containing protein [Phlebopus sp. FC_14]